MIQEGDTFEWRGQTLPYLVHDYNTTALNERAIEVPIAYWWAQHFEMMDPDVLEVGNVLNHYGWADHRVIDLYEVAEGVENIDLLDLEPLGDEYDRIVCISTLEHFNCRDDGLVDDWSPIQGLMKLFNLLKHGGEMLVTIPFGQNPYLDVFLLDGMPSQTWLRPTEQSTMERWGDGTWHERPGAHWGPAREMGWPSAVWVATWTKP